MNKDKVRVGIVAGELSGDLLGAGLIRELKKLIPNVVFEGICGKNMKGEGCISLFPMEKLSIIGILEAFVKLKYFQIVSIRKKLVNHYLSSRPDIFIGIDVPDFNLTLERELRNAGIKTIHYVSPTVWAWRSYRIKKIKKSVDHMLVMFPFEEKFYIKHDIPVTYIGHPLADKLASFPDQNEAKKILGIQAEGKVITLMPGSRRNELKHHANLFVKAACWLHERDPSLVFVAPLVGKGNKKIFRSAMIRNNAQNIPLIITNNQSHEAMIAADFVILASGTAALEAALLEKMMVVVYKLSALSYLLIRFLAHVKLYSLPNNLAGREVVPELIQKNATVEKIGEIAERYLEDDEASRKTKEYFRKMAAELRCNTDIIAAKTVSKLLKQ